MGPASGGGPTAGFWSWRKRRHGLAGAWFGVGAALKLYPLLFALPLALERLTDRDRPGAVRAVAGGAGAFAAVNLPFALAGLDGWLATYLFHLRRPVGVSGIWAWLPFRIERSLHVVVPMLLIASLLVVLVGARRVTHRDGRYPFVQTSGALLAAVLPWSKVHSPQYTLWLLAFFALLAVHWTWWAASA